MKTSCETRSCIGTVTWGVNERMSLSLSPPPSPPPPAESAFRTESVVAMWTASGPAAATRPLREATLMREAVGRGGSLHLETSWSFVSPAALRNPRPCGMPTRVSNSCFLCCLVWQHGSISHLLPIHTSVWISSRSGPWFTRAPLPPPAAAPAPAAPPRLSKLKAIASVLCMQ